MPDPVNPSGPEEQPVIAGVDDVDRLLEEAQSLASQIASGTGTTESETAPKSPASATVAEEKDALGAAEQVEKTLADLEGMLGADAQGETALDSAADSSEPAALPPDRDSETAPRKPGTIRGKNEIANIPTDAVFEGDVSVSLSDAAEGSAAEPSEPWSWKTLSARALRAARRAAIAIIKLPPRALDVLAGLLDRPFAGLSVGTKQGIGYLAITTVLAGIASFVLPPLLTSNPYLKIGVKAEAEGSEEKGGEEKKGEGKGSEGKKAEGKGSEEKKGEGKASEGKKAEGKGGEEKKGEGKGSEEKKAEGKGSEEKKGEGKASEGKKAESKHSEAKKSESKHAPAKHSEAKKPPAKHPKKE